MTYPQIGNTGVNSEDVESAQLYLSGFIVKEYHECYSNWRSTMSLGAYMQENGVVGIQGIDTRALTRHLRDKGAQNGSYPPRILMCTAWCRRSWAVPSMVGLDLALALPVQSPIIGQRGYGSLERGTPIRTVQTFATKLWRMISASSSISFAAWFPPAAM